MLGKKIGSASCESRSVIDLSCGMSAHVASSDEVPCRDCRLMKITPCIGNYVS